jgi:hypothetical protein
MEPSTVSVKVASVSGVLEHSSVHKVGLGRSVLLTLTALIWWHAAVHAPLALPSRFVRHVYAARIFSRWRGEHVECV